MKPMRKQDYYFAFIAAFCVTIGYMAIDIYLPALPILKTYFATSTAGIQTSLTIYMVGTILSYLFMGPVADHIGFRKTLLPLCVLLIIGSLVCMFAPVLWVLYLGRFIQAIAAGGMGVIGRGSYARYFPKEQATQLFMMLVPVVAVISPAVAPIIGGLLTHHLNWQSVFACLSILTVLLLLASYRYYLLEEPEDKHSKLHPLYITKTYCKLLINKHFINFLIIAFCMFAIYFFYMAEIPFIYHHMGFTTPQIGYTFAPIALMFLLSSQISRILIKTWHYKKAMLLGFITMSTGMILMILLPNVFPNSLLAILAPATLYMGTIGFISPIAISKCIMSCPKNTGYASSLTGATTILGSAVASATVNHITHASIHRLGFLSIATLAIALIAYLLAPNNT